MVRSFYVLSMDDYIAVRSGHGSHIIIYVVVIFSTVFFSDICLFLWAHWISVAACGVAYELSLAA